MLVILTTIKFHENSFSFSRVRITNRYDEVNGNFLKLLVVNV
jgi:hypothetical protein